MVIALTLWGILWGIAGFLQWLTTPFTSGPSPLGGSAQLSFIIATVAIAGARVIHSIDNPARADTAEANRKPKKRPIVLDHEL
jgi:hypothetical protein